MDGFYRAFVFWYVKVMVSDLSFHILALEGSVGNVAPGGCGWQKKVNGTTLD